MSSRMPCPKCGSGNTNLLDRSTAWNPTPNGVEYSCYMCGFRLYGQKAIDKVQEYRLMQESREALLKFIQEKEAKRMAEVHSREAQLRKGISSIRKEAVKPSPQEIAAAELIARQAEKARFAREAEAEEAARAKKEEESRLAAEAEEARSAARREHASQQAARWAEIELMREREAIRIAQIRVQQDRERGARYRAKKRAERLAAKAVGVPETLEVPAPELRIVEISYTEIITEITPAYPVSPLNFEFNVGDLPPVLEIRVSEPEEETPQSDKCAWHECDKPHTEISKYCSRDCSVKNSRARDRARARTRKIGTLDMASSAK